MRTLFRKFLGFLYALSYYLSFLRIGDIAIEDYLARNLYGSERYRKETKRLGAYEFQMFSQTGADGIITEIFHRIGHLNKFFVEFGVGDGLENNTTALLLDGWTGLWIEASKRQNKAIQRELKTFLDKRRLNVLPEFVTRDNIVSLFERTGVPHEPDLVSIDIDGNDYWVCEAVLGRYRPQLLVIEYNALIGPSVPWIMAYDPDHARESVVVTSYYGASLKALEHLCASKGYVLVGCDFLGMNAFFVREDLVGDRFCAPFTSENHFEPNRLFLYRRNGQPRKVGPYATP